MMRPLILLIVCFFSSQAIAKVRTIEMDSNDMKVITLAMGRSTVLQFADSPKKIVSGNSNYFNIEFTGNDVTIQPLSTVTSNLFIYSGHRRFGFILRVCRCNTYDDLVKIYWKAPFSRKAKPKTTNKFNPVSFKAGDMKVFLNKIFYHKFNDVYVVDGSLILPKSASDPKPEQFWATRLGKNLTVLDVVFSDETKFKKYRNYKFRMFLKLERPVDLTFRASFKGKKGYRTVLRRSYQ